MEYLKSGAEYQNGIVLKRKKLGEEWELIKRYCATLIKKDQYVCYGFMR